MGDRAGSSDDDRAIVAARAAGAAARTSLSPQHRSVATTCAVEALLALPELARPGQGGTVAISIGVRGELDLDAGAGVLRRRGWRVALPVVDGPTSMTFRVQEPDDLLVAGAFGIPVPPDDGRRALTASDLDVVVAPCVAVDRWGTRVGFGAGYYDRALADPLTRPFVVVAAFDVQVVAARLPMRSWDVGGDVVVTDRRTIRPSATAARPGRAPADGGSGGAPAR